MAEEAKIFDKIRGIYLKATPEEQVRQAIISWLESNGVVPALIGREVVLNISGRPLRADIVVYAKDMKPYFVIECKAPSVNLTEKVLMQVFEYNRELSCKYVMVTNGKQSYIFEREEISNKFIPVNDPSVIFSK